MNRLRYQAAFTLIELCIVLGVIGIVTAFAIPSFVRYRDQENAKEMANRIAGVLREARSLSVKQGVPHFVILNPDPDGAVPDGSVLVARIVRDPDGDFQESVGDLSRDVFLRVQSSSPVAAYNDNGSDPDPFPGAVRAPNDLGAGPLSNVVGGASFPLDLNAVGAHTTPTRKPSVGFTNRGIPVPVDAPTNLGAGAGAYYVTDNNQAVYAAVLGALGEVRVRTYNPATRAWQ